MSLGVHEHWNNSTYKRYSRNLGTGQGIELVALTAAKPPPQLAIKPTGNRIILTWQGSLTGCRLQSATNLKTSNSWGDVGASPALVEGQNTVTNEIAAGNRFYRLIQ